MIYTEPNFAVLDLPPYYGVVYEPYTNESHTKPHPNRDLIYKGDDYGGHNIPFPHPRPPLPNHIYEDAFVDLSAHTTHNLPEDQEVVYYT